MKQIKRFSPRLKFCNLFIKRTLLLLFGIFIFTNFTYSQSSELEIYVVCVEDLGNGSFIARFGYTLNNPNGLVVNETASKIVVTRGAGGVQQVLNVFEDGVHNDHEIEVNLPSYVFDGNGYVTWTVNLGGGTKVEAIADKNSSICGLDPYYTPPVGGKMDISSLIGAELTALANLYPFDDQISSDDIYQIKGSNPEKLVMIEIRAVDGRKEQLLGALDSDFELIYTSSSSLSVSCWYPINSLLALNSMGANLNFARPIYPPISNAGTTTTQGDKAMKSDYVRQAYGLMGEGVSIGVLSNSYATITQGSTTAAAIDVGNGDLPTDVHVVKEFTSRASDEGRAMLQIIHDIAPQAKLFFRTGFISPGDFAYGIRELVNDHNVDIIVDDITYVTEPFFYDGEVAQAVDYAASMGVSYFVAAGNFGSTAYTGTFSPIEALEVLPAGVTAHDFGGGDIYQSISLEKGNYTIVLQWDGGDPTSTDLDIYLSTENGLNPLGYNKFNIGEEAIEVLPFRVDKEGVNSNILITKASGPDVNFKYIVFRGHNILHINQYSQGTSTIVGQANAIGALTVGAVRYDNTPEFENLLQLMSFSSTGGSPISGESGLRQKPDFTAPNGVNTTVVLSTDPKTNIEGDNWPNFFGTSAAAPHAAAVAALLMNANNEYNHLVGATADPLTPEMVRAKLSNTALDMNDTGIDYQSGYGFIQADAAMATIIAPMPELLALVNTTEITPGQAPFILKVQGAHFIATSEVLLRGVPLVTNYISENELEVTIPVFTGNPEIQVRNQSISISGLDGGISNPMLFYDIPKKNLFVTAINVEKFYGQEIPDFGVTIKVQEFNDSDILVYDPVTDLLLVELESLIQYYCSATLGSLTNVGDYVINPYIDTSLNVTMELYESLVELYNFEIEVSSPIPLCNK